MIEKKIKRLSNLANWAMMIGLFFNPFGFDAVQFWFYRLTGSLWYANFIMYGIAALFFGLSFYFRYRCQVNNKLAKKKSNEMGNPIKSIDEFLNESKFPHEIKSEKYWRKIVYGDKYLDEVLDTIMKKQGGWASDRQMAVLRRKERGDTSPYPTKN